MIEIKLLNKQGLAEYIDSEEYKTSEVIAISPQRARSQLKNPRLEEHDILLILAYENAKLVGYLGALPDRMYGARGEVMKFAWFTCMWVDPELRRKQVGILLMTKGFEVWEQKNLITDFAPSSKKLFDKIGFYNDLETREGIRLYVRSDLHQLLPPRKPIFNKIKGLLKIIDAVANAFLDIRFLFWHSKTSHLRFEYLQHIDREVEHFLADKLPQERFRRGVEELNWIIQNPWVLAAPEQDYNSRRYYFSAIERAFDFYTLKVCNEANELIAFMIFSKRNQTLKLPFCYYNKGDVATVAAVIHHHIVQWRIKTFSTFRTEIADYLSKNSSPALLKRPMKRGYLISTDYDASVLQAQLEIQDGDADCAFT